MPDGGGLPCEVSAASFVPPTSSPPVFNIHCPTWHLNLKALSNAGTAVRDGTGWHALCRCRCKAAAEAAGMAAVDAAVPVPADLGEAGPGPAGFGGQQQGAVSGGQRA